MITIKLHAYINADNQLSVSFDDGGKPVSMPRSAGIEALLPQRAGATSIAVEVSDFFQFGAVYDVYGATLEDAGLGIAAHWESTGHGRRHQFTIAPGDRPRKVRFLIGATPRKADAPVPAPFISFEPPGGGLPVVVDPRDRG